MGDPRPTCGTMSIEEATISNMGEIAAIVEAEVSPMVDVSRCPELVVLVPT